MANMALGFAELIAGVVLLDSALTNRTVGEVIKGEGSSSITATTSEPAGTPAGAPTATGEAGATTSVKTAIHTQGSLGGAGPSHWVSHTAPAPSAIKVKANSSKGTLEFFKIMRERSLKAGTLKE